VFLPLIIELSQSIENAENEEQNTKKHSKSEFNFIICCLSMAMARFCPIQTQITGNRILEQIF
jgi:hypothetical protein